MNPIYDQKANIKIIVAVLALLFGAATVVYTNILVQRVSEREQDQIQLYAKAQRFIINSEVVDSNTNFVFDEIINANTTIPIILTDADSTSVVGTKNVDIPRNLSVADSVALVQRVLADMKRQHPPIVVELGAGARNYIFYKDSQLLTQLRTYPLAGLGVIASLAVMAYFAFSYSRRSEQNRVWVGLAKETAHQLGTPLSSLVGGFFGQAHPHAVLLGAPQKALEYQQRYGVDGVMIGRASIGYPWIFREVKHYVATGQLLAPPTLDERVAMCQMHFDRSVEWKGPKVGIFEMRRHYAHYFRGLEGAKAWRTRLVEASTPAEVYEILHEIAGSEAVLVG